MTSPRSVRSVCGGAVSGSVAVVVVVIIVVASSARRSGRLDMPTAVVLGLVEGLTEFLPVSSTGHLAVVVRLFDLRGSAADAYVIVVQAGAILAVLVLFRERLQRMRAGLLGRDADGRRLVRSVGVAFVPAAVIGFAFGDAIKDRLFGVGPVAAALAVGGIVILAVGRRIPGGGAPLEEVAWRGAAIIGVAQALALWPGVSRSLVTILAGVAVGLSLSAAVDFSFLLGLVTLGAATALEIARQGSEIVDRFGVGAPLVGFAVAFVAAVASVRWLVAYVRDGSLLVFGWYRLLSAAIALALLLSGAV